MRSPGDRTGESHATRGPRRWGTPADQDTQPFSPGEELERSVRRMVARHHRVEGLLGQGGMSIVYLARETDLNRLVALKVLPLQLVLGPEAPERFVREAKIAASLDHPHILPVYRVGSNSTFMWYAMKYVRGRSLAKVLAEAGRLELPTCLDVVSQVAGALSYAHRRGIVHRDVKPENVLLDDHGWAWVCDFGVAKAFGAVPLTQTGGTLGTPGYMSPEQCFAHELDGRADQYALAILVYECLAGRPPFVADSIGEMIRMQCFEAPPTLASVRPDLPPDVSDALARALSKKPDDRFETVHDLVAALGGTVADEAARSALRSVVRSVPETPPVDPDLPQGARPARGRRLLAAVLSVPVVAMVAAVGIGRAPGVPDARAATPPVLPAMYAAPPPSPPTIPTSPPVPRARPAPAADGWLSVQATPWGNVFVDDSLVGTTPLLRFRVPAGAHVVRIVNDGFEPYERTIHVQPDSLFQMVDVTLAEKSGT